MGKANPAWLAEGKTPWKQHPDQYGFYLNTTQAKLNQTMFRLGLK